MRSRYFIFHLLFIAAICNCVYAPAQTVDTAIQGAVTDTSGAAIPGATVIVSSVATGLRKQAVTNSNGDYSITYLTPGNYDVTATASGFGSSAQKNVVLQINQQAKVSLIMGVACQQQTVQVEGTQPLLQ